MSDLDRLFNAELLLALQHLSQRLALDVGHDVVEERVGLARIVQRQDVGMLQVGGDLDLGQEALGPDHGRQLGLEHLQRHLALVLHVLRQEDSGHPALAELALDDVAVGQGDLQLLGDLGHTPSTGFGLPLPLPPQPCLGVGRPLESGR
jgi:hypothetical protein